MQKYSLHGKDISFTITSDKYEVNEGDTFTISVQASGVDATPGLKLYYRVIGTVRNDDYIKNNEFGLLELDSNLEATQSFKIREDYYSEVSEYFTFILVFSPSYYCTVKVNNVENSLPPYPPKPVSPLPSLKIRPLSLSILEGEEAHFIVEFENLKKYQEVEFYYTDTTQSYSNALKVRVSSIGYANISIPTIKKEASRLINIWSKDFPKVRASIRVEREEISFTGVYIPGEYLVQLPPNSSAYALLVGGGGSGANAIEEETGSDGEDTSLNISGVVFKAGGGKAGTHYYTITKVTEEVNPETEEVTPITEILEFPAEPGQGGEVTVGSFVSVTVIRSFAGARGSELEEGDYNLGGSLNHSLLPPSYSGKGGTGRNKSLPNAWGRQPYGTSTWGRGIILWELAGGGGSGAILELLVTNTGITTQTLKLNVGSKGIGNSLNNLNSDGDNGLIILN